MIFIKKCLLFLTLLVAFSHQLFSYEYELTACAVFRDDAPYIREWVCFHRAQGVEKFYLYDNLSCDRWNLELDDLICSGVVEIIPWPYHACSCEMYEEICCKAYMNCIERVRHKTKWCAFLNCQEFLFCPTGRPLCRFLKKYKDSPCLCINRQVYGTSNIFQAPCGALTRFLFWKCHPNHPCCKPVKCIVQPKYVVGCNSCGWFTLKPGLKCINPNKQKVKKKCCNNRILIDKIRINYYIYRDSYFYDTFYRNNYCCCQFELDYGCNINLNEVYDDCILRVCPPLEY